MRFGAILVSLSLAVSLVIQPPKAKAFAAVGQLYTVISAYMASCGLSWGVQGMDETGFGEQVARLLQDYLDTEFAGQTPLEWAGDISVIATPQGKLQIPKILAGKLADFANWTIETLGIKAGESVVVHASSLSLLCADGSHFRLGAYSDGVFSDYGDCLELGTDLFLVSGARFVWPDGDYLYFYTADGKYYSSYGFPQHNGTDYSKRNRAVLCVNLNDMTFHVAQQLIHDDGKTSQPVFPWKDMRYLDLSILGSNAFVNSGGLSIDAATAIDVPDTSTMSDDEALEIGVGAAAGVALDVLLKQILEAILAGNLTATKEIAKAEEAVKPGEIIDVDGLGLPALSIALTTRFPFSIPWDVVRGIKLVAAPPKAPYWKVDFMAPISGRVGGWKGETSIEIDMGKYPIIGQLCRWTSTIGFCLVLASGTKRLIWTA